MSNEVNAISIDRIARISEVETIVGLKRAMIYRLISRGEFPRPVKLTKSGRSGGASGWKLSTLSSWVSSREAA